MAKAISDEELELKKRARRRLVGAIALVLVVVVFLPMVLDNEPRPLSEDIEINVPPLPAEDAPSSLPPPVAMESNNAAQAQKPEAAPAPPPVADVPAPKPRDVVPAKPATVTKAAERPAREEYVVQLGAFSNATNARQLAAKVRDNRFKVYTEVVKTDSGDRTRVRVGPFSSKDAADKAKARLKALKLTFGEPAVLRADE